MIVTVLVIVGVSVLSVVALFVLGYFISGDASEAPPGDSDASRID